MKSLFTTLLLSLFITVGLAFGQGSSYVLLDESTMQIDGTSTVHDWTSDVEVIQADISFAPSAVESDSLQNPVESLKLTIPVENIESGKGGMDRRTYDALKKDDHPNILFELSSAEVTETKADTAFTLKTSGTLQIAGVSKDITLPVKATVQEDGTYKFTGDYNLNMKKDFKVDPPSAMFGTIKAGEEVTISFNLMFNTRENS